MITLTPSEIHEAKLTIEWLEKNTPEQWATFTLEDSEGKRRLVGHLNFREHGNARQVVKPVSCIIPFLSIGVNLAGLNNSLGGNKRAIISELKKRIGII